MEQIFKSLSDIFIAYLMPIIATNIIVDYAKGIIPTDKRKIFGPITCMIASVVVGMAYAAMYYISIKEFFIQIFYTFTMANLVYSLGVFDFFKNFILEKITKLVNKEKTGDKNGKQ